MKIVTLRLFKGAETYNKEGKLTSENQLYKIPYDTFEWEKFKKNVKYTFTNAEVVALNKQSSEVVYEQVGDKKVGNTIYSYEPLEVTQDLLNEVRLIFAAPEKPMTPEQKQIAELQKKLEELMSVKQVKEPVKEPVKVDNSELEAVRDEYLKVVGKKPHHKLSIEKMQEEINTKS